MPKTTPAAITDLPVYQVTTMRPADATPEMLGLGRSVSQVRVAARAKSRAEFARKIIAAGLDYRSPAAVTAWLKNYSSITANPDTLAAVTDERVYIQGHESTGDAPRVPYPPQN